MKAIGAALAAVTMTVWLGSCATLRSATPPLEGSAWALAELPGAQPVRGAPATLRFEGGRAQGSDGCNSFSVAYVAKDGALDFPSSAATTRRSCPPDVTKQADVFLLALSGAHAYRIDGGRLQLLGADGAVRATFVPQSQVLAGTRWRATAINNGKGALASPMAGASAPTLAFEAGGRVSGMGGCNPFAGTYRSEGGGLAISPAPTTRHACAEAVMDQEDAFLKALQSVTALRMDGDRLELRNAEGALAAIFTRDAAGG